MRAHASAAQPAVEADAGAADVTADEIDSTIGLGSAAAEAEGLTAADVAADAVYAAVSVVGTARGAEAGAELGEADGSRSNSALGIVDAGGSDFTRGGPIVDRGGRGCRARGEEAVREARAPAPKLQHS
jgi:hypothetical protein